MSYTRIREQKRHINKPDESYWCDLLHREAGYIILKYDVTRDSHIGPISIPAGSVTIAHYRENTAYVLWEMYGPDRQLIGYCYHICLPPEIRETHVEYLDLLLDLWLDPDGELTVLDEDELQQARAEGKVERDQMRLIDCEREAIQEGHMQIIKTLWRPPAGVEKL